MKMYPPPEAVDIWLWRYPDDARLDDFSQLLDADEHRVWRRYTSYGAARQYLASRAMVRLILSSYTGVASKAWRFRRGVYGKPYIAAPADAGAWGFNVSHVEGTVALAICNNAAVGVDIERIQRNIDPFSMAKHAFTITEAACVTAAHSDKQLELFFRIWTLKEAYLKTLGTGFRVSPDSVQVDMYSWPPTVRAPQIAHNDHQILFAQYKVHESLVLALGFSHTARAEINVREFDPGKSCFFAESDCDYLSGRGRTTPMHCVEYLHQIADDDAYDKHSSANRLLNVIQLE